MASNELEAPRTSFLGVPLAEHAFTPEEADFGILGVPYGVPYRMTNLSADVTTAPDAIRERSSRFAGHLDHYDFDLGGTLLGDSGAKIADFGNVTGDPWNIEGNAVAGTREVRKLLDTRTTPIILGGDDSVPIICLNAFENSTPIVNILQIDAHIDYRDEVNGVYNGYSSPMRRIREMPWVGRIVQVGARGTGSATPKDVSDAITAGNIILPAEQLHAEGLDAVWESLIDDLPWFITLDVDGLDPTIAPGTSCPLPGGLTFSQAAAIMRFVGRELEFAGIDIVEHYPSLDVRDTTSVTIIRLLTNLLGNVVRNGSYK